MSLSRPWSGTFKCRTINESGTGLEPDWRRQFRFLLAEFAPKCRGKPALKYWLKRLGPVWKGPLMVPTVYSAICLLDNCNSTLSSKPYYQLWHEMRELSQHMCPAKSSWAEALAAMRGLVLYVSMHGVVFLLQYAATPAILLLAILHLAPLCSDVGFPMIYASPILAFTLGNNHKWEMQTLLHWPCPQQHHGPPLRLLFGCTHIVVGRPPKRFLRLVLLSGSSSFSGQSTPSLTLCNSNPEPAVKKTRCLGAIQPNREHMERFLSGWFPNACFADLRRGNIEQWYDKELFFVVCETHGIASSS